MLTKIELPLPNLVLYMAIVLLDLRSLLCNLGISTWKWLNYTQLHLVQFSHAIIHAKACNYLYSGPLHIRLSCLFVLGEMGLWFNGEWKGGIGGGGRRRRRVIEREDSGRDRSEIEMGEGGGKRRIGENI